jgi:hypothetical protein
MKILSEIEPPKKEVIAEVQYYVLSKLKMKMATYYK